MNITERKLKLSCPNRSSLFAQIWQNLPYMARMGVISTSKNGGVLVRIFVGFLPLESYSLTSKC